MTNTQPRRIRTKHWHTNPTACLLARRRKGGFGRVRAHPPFIRRVLSMRDLPPHWRWYSAVSSRNTGPCRSRLPTASSGPSRRPKLNTRTIDKICAALSVRPGDLFEYVPDSRARRRSTERSRQEAWSCAEFFPKHESITEAQSTRPHPV